MCLWVMCCLKRFNLCKTNISPLQIHTWKIEIHVLLGMPALFSGANLLLVLRGPNGVFCSKRVTRNPMVFGQPRSDAQIQGVILGRFTRDLGQYIDLCPFVVVVDVVVVVVAG